MRKTFDFPFYILLIAILPILRFYKINWKSFTPGDLLQAFLLYVFGAIVLLLISRLIWRNWSRGAVALAPLLVTIVLGKVIGLVVSCALVFSTLLLGGLLFFYRPNLDKVSILLNVTLIVFVALSIGGSVMVVTSAEPIETAELFDREIKLSADIQTAPDIYYIIMDGLGRPRVLEQVYGIPRSTTYDALTRLGFRVMENSTVSYIQTSLSLSSTFNLSRIQDLLKIEDPTSRDRRVLGSLFQRNRIVRALGELGYRIETFPSGYPLTRIDEADRRHLARFIPGFATYVVMSDGFLPLIQPLLGGGPADLSFALRRRQIDYVFDHLPDLAKQEREDPVFVFAHVLAPHPPFVFGPGGEPLTSRRSFTYSDGSHWMKHHEPDTGHYRQDYRNQAVFLMHRLTETVAEILRVSRRPAIIVIQGDHGPGSMLDWENPAKSGHFERFGIFNAWYVPGKAGKDLPDAVPAINTFPVLLNAVFGEDLPMQRDELWYSRWSAPYVFIPLKKNVNP